MSIDKSTSMWVQFSQQLCDYLASKEDSQEELIALLEKVGIDIDNITHLRETKTIDPLLFYYLLFGFGKDRRIEHAKSIAREINIVEPDANMPVIATIVNTRKDYVEKNVIESGVDKKIWEIFNIVKSQDFEISDKKFGSLFDEMINPTKKPYGFGIRMLTSFLNFVNPYKIYPVYYRFQKFCKEQYEIEYKWGSITSYTKYLYLMNQIKEKIQGNISLFDFIQKADKFCEDNKLQGEPEEEDGEMENRQKSRDHHPLNTILYGLPGTGKTYNTIKMAAEILENQTIDNYEDAREIFKEARKTGRVEFVTFHQSYSYEDFIQGIKPDVDDEHDSMTFSRIDGVFKRIAKKARKSFEDSQKGEEEIAKENRFEQALEKFKDDLINGGKNEKGVYYDFNTESGVGIFDICKNRSFRITGKNWSMSVTFDLLKFLYDNQCITKDDLKKKDIQFQRQVAGRTGASYVWNIMDEINKRMDMDEKGVLEKPPSLQNFVIIIDEINRANISRVFGELITLIEPDKRLGAKNELSVTLPSAAEDEEEFSVPPNLYIIGTMNTADKSIALLDVALRRRFEFRAMYPDMFYDLASIQEKEFLMALNEKITEDKGADFQIGHSYFMETGEGWNFERCLKTKVIPLLLEYYRNDDKKILEILKAVKDTEKEKIVEKIIKDSEEKSLFRILSE